MKKYLTLALLTMFAVGSTNLKAQGDRAAYVLYGNDGKLLNYNGLVAMSTDVDVVLFGELHNNPICHWLQLLLAESLSQQGELVLGAEMFETDDQLVIDEYTSGVITKDHLTKEAKVWPNFETDYLPLVDLAKSNQLPFIATNVPRRYAALVSKNGQTVLLDLSAGALALMPRLPYVVTANDRGYSEMAEMMGTHGHGMSPQNFIEAQALKDYTMASNIAAHMPAQGVFLHFNGSFHSQYRAGIVGYLSDLKPKASILVIAAVESDSLEFQEEWSALGDVILVVPANMTKTH